MKLLLVLAISTILGITNVSTEEPQASIEEPPGVQLEAPIKPVIKEKKKAVSKPAPKPKPPVQAPSVPTVQVTGSCAEYLPLVSQYDWDVPTMMRIMKAESGCDPTNHNFGDIHKDANGNVICYGSWGLFNVGCVHGHSMQAMENPAANIKAAYKVWNGGNYAAWTTWR